MISPQTPPALRVNTDTQPMTDANVEAVRAALQRFLDAGYSTSPRFREIVDQAIAECPEASSQDTKREHQ